MHKVLSITMSHVEEHDVHLKVCLHWGTAIPPQCLHEVSCWEGPQTHNNIYKHYLQREVGGCMQNAYMKLLCTSPWKLNMPWYHYMWLHFSHPAQAISTRVQCLSHFAQGGQPRDTPPWSACCASPTGASLQPPELWPHPSKSRIQILISHQGSAACSCHSQHQ